MLKSMAVDKVLIHRFPELVSESARGVFLQLKTAVVHLADRWRLPVHFGPIGCRCHADRSRTVATVIPQTDTDSIQAWTAWRVLDDFSVYKLMCMHVSSR